MTRMHVNGKGKVTVGMYIYGHNRTDSYDMIKNKHDLNAEYNITVDADFVRQDGDITVYKVREIIGEEMVMPYY